MFFKKKQRPQAPIVHARDDDFTQLVEDRRGITIVDFWAPWCGPCKMMGPILDELAIEQEDRGVQITKVNVDHAPETAERFGIRSIPTLIFFQDGEPLFEMVGIVSKPIIEREIAELG